MRHLCLILLLASTLVAQGPETGERRLSNGVRVLVVERPSGGMVHAALFVRNGRGDSGGLPSNAVELLARSLFGHHTAADITATPEALVQEEESLYQSLRFEILQRSRTEPGAPPPDVATLHAKALARLKATFGESAALDLMEQLGITTRSIHTYADYISTSVDLPSANLEAWAKLEAQRISQIHLYRFPLERERWLEALRGVEPSEPGLSPLLGSAFVGQRYSSALDENPGAIAGLTRGDARTLAAHLLAPDHLLLVLVGDLSMNSLFPTLEGTFGRLGSTTEGEPFATDLQPTMGALRLEVSRSTHPRLYLGWRIPPASDPDTYALRLTAQILGHGASSRLRGVVDRGMADSVKTELGVPGARAMNLLLITAEPGGDHGLPELEMALRGEVLRLQEELVSGEELQKALSQIDLQQLRTEGDPAALAAALGSSWVVLGDWRQAFTQARKRQEARPEEIQRVARQYLSTERAVVGLVAPDRSAGEDPLDLRLAQALRLLAKKKGIEPAKAETLVQEGLRQLHLLAREQRVATLRLLESQPGGVPPKEVR